MSIVLNPAASPTGGFGRLLTIEEYAALPDDGRFTELVRGKVIEMPRPKARHGQVCGTTSFLLRSFSDDYDLGHVLTNDSGVIVSRDPDTLRGPDIAFYSYTAVPKGPLPDEYLKVMPEIVFEVKSSDDRWKDILEKIAEYLNAGVLAVCVLDPEESTAYVYPADTPPRTFTADQVLELPAPLGAFRVEVSKFFA